MGAPVDLTDTLVGSDPRLAVDAAGDVTAVWNWNAPEHGSEDDPVERPRSAATGTWAIRSTSPATRERSIPQVAVAPTGERSRRGTASPAPVRRSGARLCAPGGSWDAAVDLSDGDPNVHNPQAAIDLGRPTRPWSGSSVDAIGNIVRASSRAPGGAVERIRSTSRSAMTGRGPVRSRRWWPTTRVT